MYSRSLQPYNLRKRKIKQIATSEETRLFLAPYILKLFESFTKNIVACSTLFESGFASIPKLEGVCEDAFFIKGNCFGVADGVGGWRTQIDASLYAKSLVQFAQNAIEKLNIVQPLSIMEYAYRSTCVQETKGASTLCLVTVEDNGRRLCASNLGDSRFIIFRVSTTRKQKNNKRKYTKLISSFAQQSAFNTPFQLGHQSPDTPSLAQQYEINIFANDLVVVGTDGLFDNLFHNEMENKINELFANKEPTASQIAHCLAYEAFRISNIKTVTTPFSEEAFNAKVPYRGGKPDDITVIVAKIL